MTDIVGLVPVDGIPLQTWEHGATELFHLVGSFFGGGGLTAGQLKEEMDNVQWDDLDLIKTRLDGASSYLTGDFQTKLSSILDKLNDAYQGEANDIMASRFQQAQQSATTIAPTFSQLSGRVGDIHTALTECAKSVGGYSRFGSDVSDVTSAFGFGESQDDKARDAWNKCAGSFESTGSAMPFASGGATTFQNYAPPTQVPTQPPAAVPGTASVGGPGPGPGTVKTPQIKTPNIKTPKTPVIKNPKEPKLPKVHGPGTPGPGTPGPGGIGPGGIGPGGIGPGGIGPGGIGPGGVGPGGYGPGGYGPGAGIDTGSQLAGYGPGPGGPGPGPGGVGPGGVGPGFGVGSGPGAGLGDGSGLNGSGLAGSGLAGSGLAGGGVDGGAGTAEEGAAGAGGRGGVGGVPMGARGGGGSGSDSDRERSTWLNEDDDVWGGSDAPDGVIS